MKITDLSVLLFDGFPPYPGDIPISMKPKGVHSADGYSVHNLTFSSHAGTHVDLPYHFLEDGMTIEESPLECFIGEAVVLSIVKNELERIEASDFAAADIRTNDIVLLSTGWEKHTGTSFFYKNHPYLSLEAADYLLGKRVKALGCDMPSIDIPNRSDVHRAVLGGNVVIFESLINLDKIAGKRVQFIGLPLRIAGGDGSPIRAIAIEP